MNSSRHHHRFYSTMRAENMGFYAEFLPSNTARSLLKLPPALVAVDILSITALHYKLQH
jgi:hypothetical protein